MSAKHPGLTVTRVLSVLHVLCVLSVLAQAPQGHAQDASAARSGLGEGGDQEAATRFRRGLALFNDSEYELALIEFERAYELAPNFRAFYNIGLVNVQLGRYASATRAFERYLQDGGALVALARRGEVEGLLNELKLRTATLTLLSRANGIEVVCDGKSLGVTPFVEPLLIDAGEHTLRASSVGFATKTYALTLAGQDEATVQVVLVPLPRNEPASASKAARTIFWPGIVATAALAAGAVAGSIIMLDARSHLESLKDKPGSADDARRNAADRAQVAAVTADVLTGLAVVTGGLTLYLSLRKERPKSAPDVALSPHYVRATFRF